jgi:hypothetical protein
VPVLHGGVVSAEEHLRRLLAGTPASRRYQWHHVLSVMRVVTSERSAVREALLRRVALNLGRLQLDPHHGMAHAMPPEDVLRCIAVDTLAAWGRRRHRDVFRRVLGAAEREIVMEVARAALRRTR